MPERHWQSERGRPRPQRLPRRIWFRECERNVPCEPVAGADARCPSCAAARGAGIAAHVSEYLLTSDLQPAFQPLFWVCEFRLSPSRFWLPHSAFFILHSAFPPSRPPELLRLRPLAFISED